MATRIRAMCQWNVGTLLPRDVMQITPCFEHSATLGDLGQVDYDALANDLATGLQTWVGATPRQLTVKLYEIENSDKPNRPKSTVIKNPGVSPEASFPRELAVCLSFNGGNNSPDKRGRLYVPLIPFGASTLGPRPSAAIMQKAADLVPLFTGLGGSNVDWGVWSPSRRTFTAAERWFVDDEWDVQRRRGLKPGARNSGTTTEA
jgi:hypothetical protein